MRYGPLHTLLLAFKYLESPLLTLIYYQLGKPTKIKIKNSDVFFWGKKGSGTLSHVLYALDKGIKIKWADKRQKEYLFEFNSIKLVQPNIGALGEDLEQLWIKPCQSCLRSSTVLDVGAYFGETAVLFAKYGAKKIIAVEPVPLHLVYIKRNAQLNGLEEKIQILPYAVGANDGTITLSSSAPPGSEGFGLEPGEFFLQVQSVSWSTLIDTAIKLGTTIVKSDCEGCERFIPTVDPNTIRRIPLWLIEVHDKSTEKILSNFFRDAGFKVERLYTNTSYPVYRMIRSSVRDLNNNFCYSGGIE